MLFFGYVQASNKISCLQNKFQGTSTNLTQSYFTLLVSTDQLRFQIRFKLLPNQFFIKLHYSFSICQINFHFIFNNTDFPHYSWVERFQKYLNVNYRTVYYKRLTIRKLKLRVNNRHSKTKIIEKRSLWPNFFDFFFFFAKWKWF